MNSDNVFKSFEHINLNVVSGKLNTRLIVIYRPPPSKKNKLTTSMFFTEFHDLLELMSQHEQPLLIAGDFNFHLDDTTNCDTIKFMDILDSANLSQHVLGSTHRKGHTLDLIITQHNSNLVTDVRILNDVFSDHQVVTCKLNCPRPPLSKIPLTFRSTKQLNGDVFIATLKESLANQDLSVKTDIDEMVDIYNSTLKDIYDKLAPVQTRVVNHRPWAPWYNEDLREAKREKRRAERKFRKTKLTVNKQMYIEACERYNRLLENCKTSYYKNKIEGADRNRLFCLVNSLFKTSKNILPTHNSREVLADEFNTYFINKIRGIRNEIEKLHPASQTKDTMSAILPLTQLSEFNLPDNNATEKVIRSMPSKTCSLDPIPTHVVKNHLNLLLPAIQSIIISSLSSGTFPSQLKISQVKPKLKKNDLDKNLYSNYRPIANIAFVSKVIEKIVASQVHAYLRDAKLFPTLQSAYRQYHSTETAMIKVTNDILRAIDDYSDVILVLLDLSAAFDTLDHQILLSRLKSYFWFYWKCTTVVSIVSY